MLWRVKYSRRSEIDDVPSQLALALEAAAVARPDAIDLTVSNPTRVGLSYAAYGAFAELAASGMNTYAPDPLGLASARQAVAQHWPGAGPRPDPEHVLLLPSSSEAYHYLFTLLCDVGDEVLVPEPSYPLLAHLGRYAGVSLVPYQLAYDGAWHIDLESARRARSERTRALILISPNNPTGSYTSQRELDALAELGLPLLSDEVFARFAFSPRLLAPRSALGATGALTFCIDGLSKSAGLPQAKLSWIAVSGPGEAVQESMRRLTWLGDTFLSVATPIQLMLPTLLERSSEFRAGLLERLVQNRVALNQALAGSAASLLEAEGGWYAVVRLPDLASEEEWVLGLLSNAGVMTHPGHFYDFYGSAPHLVLSLLPEPAPFARGARALRGEVDRRSALSRGA
jgi:aspartate/methionine/tyrosine aminotransferase